MKPSSPQSPYLFSASRHGDQTDLSRSDDRPSPARSDTSSASSAAQSTSQLFSMQTTVAIDTVGVSEGTDIPETPQGYHRAKKPLLRRTGLYVTMFLVVVIAAITLSFVLPRTMHFAYAGPTCQFDLTLVPSFRQPYPNQNFAVKYSKALRVASFPLVSAQTCVTPSSAPNEGVSSVKMSPRGLRLLATKYNIQVAPSPRVVGSVRGASTLAITQPLTFKLDQPDKVFSYTVEAGEKTTECSVKNVSVTCKLDTLTLAQGTLHTVALIHEFEGEKVEKLTDSTVSILPAVAVTGTSIKNDETVYVKPKEITVTTDKPLQSIRATLEEVGPERNVMPLMIAYKGKDTTLQLLTDLPREKTFRLRVESAMATDGSILAQPIRVLFRTSGAPKVKGTTIGTSGVGANAKFAVEFDQPIAQTVDITKFVTLTGASATISRQGEKVLFALQNVPRCTSFTITILKGLEGESGMISTADWTFSSRVACRQTVTIGTSVQGRPIVAYYFGSGPTSVLFTGGIHGSEPSGTYLMEDWANYLEANPVKIPTDKQIVIVPSINPDGIAAKDRYNARGVNLDRNFPSSDWATDIAVAGGGMKAGGGGGAPASEPETQALMALTSSLKLRAVISYHAQGSLVGINEYADSDAIGNLYASAVGYKTMFYNAEETMGYTFSGEYESWIAEKLSAPAVLIELPTTNGRFLAKHLDALWKMVNL